MAIFNPDGSIEGISERQLALATRGLTDEEVCAAHRRNKIDRLAVRRNDALEVSGQWGGSMRKRGGVGYR